MTATTTGLIERLAEIRALNCEQLTTPEMAVFARALSELRRTDILQRCLQFGETAPNFEFRLTDGVAGSLFDLLKSGPVVLNFFRGFWCAYCQSELQAYEEICHELRSKGCHYLAISPQQPGTGDVLAGHAIHDRGNQIARSFGLLYQLGLEEVRLFSDWGLMLDQLSETGRWELPLPAIYVINSDRTVAYSYVDPDFRNRCCPDLLLREVDYLTKRAPS